MSEIGDRRFGHGDQVTRTNSTGAEIEAGSWVGPTGDTDVAKADANGGPDGLVGVVEDPLPDGETGKVHVRGVVYGLVEDDVVAGDELGVPNTSTGVDSDADTAGVAPPEGSSGVYALEDAQSDGNGNWFAKCLIR